MPPLLRAAMLGLHFVRKERPMTIIWFVVWLAADLVGDAEPLRFDPVNWWTGTLLLAIALDLNRPEVGPRRK